MGRHIKFPMKRRTFLDDLGLSLSGKEKAICYTEKGFLWWAPQWVKHGIAHVWNRTACIIRGHDTMAIECFKLHELPGKPTCCWCNKHLKVDGRYPTSEELKANDDIVYAKWDKYTQESF